ncbi:SH3 domain-containing protein [Caulobacter soli]|uniref:SH3 domain-containing protein n=1 Tax=Caulobacter soli TaxID=2708539 RepID=UPI0013EA0774|nr:SH3 domain-containing protein [Caulobacter soli]
MKLVSGLVMAGLTLSTIAPSAALAQAKASKGQAMQTQASGEVPHCGRKLGTLSIVDGDDSSGWTQYNLASPQKVLRAIVQRSGCFNLVDRGAGLSAAEKERNIGGNLGLQRGSNVGQGQVKAADYVLVAEVQGSNSNVGGGAVAGAIGGLIGGRVGGLVGGIKTKKLEANTVLSLTNVRTTETMSVSEGYAVKNDIGWGAGGGLGFAGAVGGGYEDTDIGRIVTLSFINAYSKMVSDLGLLSTTTTAAAAAPPKTFVASRVTNMRATAAAGGKLIRALPAGAIVYPTGEKNGLWWEVADENDNVGWVLNTGLEPAR